MIFALLAFLILVTLVVASYTLYKLRNLHLLVYSLLSEIKELRLGGLTDLFNQLHIDSFLKQRLQLERPLPAMRDWAASPDFLMPIVDHVLQKSPKVVLECGSGVSTLVVARCLQLNGEGHVYTLDHEPDYAERTRELLKAHDLQEWATVIDAPLEKYASEEGDIPWYSVSSIPDLEIDVLIVDGPPQPSSPKARYPAGPLLFTRLSTSGVVFIDDADTAKMQKVIALWEKNFDEISFRREPAEKGLLVGVKK